MGHTGGPIHKDAMPFTTSIDSGANRQPMSVASGDGRSSTGHGESLINSDDTTTASGHVEGVSWDRRCISANILGSKTPYNFITTGHGRGMTGEGMGLRSGDVWDNFCGNVRRTTNGCNCNMEN